MIHRSDPGKRSKEEIQIPTTGDQPLPGIDPKPSKRPKTKRPPKPETAEYRRLVEVYFEAYEQSRHEKPDFGKAEGEAIKALLRKRGLEESERIIRSVYAHDWWASKATIKVIASDPGKFSNLDGGPNKVQQGTRPDEDWRDWGRQS